MKTYIKEKIKLLREFGIKLNAAQKAHIYSLKTEIAVDNFAHDLLKPTDMSHLEIKSSDDCLRFKHNRRAFNR